ncbi:hypothetical protein F0562_032652 [Nyssa sinensis]|uniref:Uncharacterized protein n=1 Tax=Nyssa sinensis TaxID=561372 RepID=A0A5J5AS38_9ASTE|nr:hypothetical protein F0562_032652 [Nyssa sinensis]
MNSSGRDDLYRLAAYSAPPKIVTGRPVSPMNQQAPIENRPGTQVAWSTGLCGCCEDISSCCLTCWCPCISFGYIAEIIDKGSTSCGTGAAIYAIISCFTCLGCCYSCFYRSKMRREYMLKEGPCCDCLVHSCCEPCALCQEQRELKSRDFDLSIGWHENMERQNHRMAGAPTAPVVEGMYR